MYLFLTAVAAIVTLILVSANIALLERSRRRSNDKRGHPFEIQIERLMQKKTK